MAGRDAGMDGLDALMAEISAKQVQTTVRHVTILICKF
jgi:hypothetical protein